MTDEETNAKIASLNDRFRKQIPYTNGGKERIPGQTVMTRGIAEYSPDVQSAIILKVRSFDHFDEDNDPYGTHEFGAFTLACTAKIFWKIDIYENSDCLFGSAHPDDPMRSYRVLTILLASEY